VWSGDDRVQGCRTPNDDTVALDEVRDNWTGIDQRVKATHLPKFFMYFGFDERSPGPLAEPASADVRA